MEANLNNLESAFLAWINQLNLISHKLSSITELRDGTILAHLLNTA